ncbi:hypothetical protein FRC08_001663 [Ceratobasidium sp. 394]|nr:hypothetical protein FRC08_001663 [Ceratobasidium sp. 394]
MKVHQIQQKLESALADHRQRRSHSVTSGSASEADSIQRVLSEGDSAARRVRTPRGASRLAEGATPKRRRSRSSASIRAAREALMAVKDAVPPIPKTPASGTPNGSVVGHGNETVPKIPIRAGMTATPERSSIDSTDLNTIAKPFLDVMAFPQTQGSPRMPLTPLTPSRGIAEDSDDSYLSAVSETARGVRSGSGSDEDTKRIMGRRMHRKSGARMPSPAVSEATAVGTARAV